MKILRLTLFFLAWICCAVEAEPAPKKWTLLVFINGNNNLTNYARYNLIDMEKVGSNENINVVVQLARKKNSAKRLLVQRSSNTRKITSPILEQLDDVDMASLETLESFLEWGIKNFPAEHYFIDIWNHGRGWKKMASRGISFDDQSGRHLNMLQLAQAMRYAEKLMGHKVDVLGTDACLMAMSEVASEVSDSVDFLMASEETVPGEGWPYSDWLQQWSLKPDATPIEIGRILSKSYVNFYENIFNNQSEDLDSEDEEAPFTEQPLKKQAPSSPMGVTFSVLDLKKMSEYNYAISNLKNELLNLEPSDRETLRQMLPNVMHYEDPDYVDFGDFLASLERAPLNAPIRYSQAFVNSQKALSDLVVANETTEDYKRSQGISIWLPREWWLYAGNIERYRQLNFERSTHWSEFIDSLLDWRGNNDRVSSWTHLGIRRK